MAYILVVDDDPDLANASATVLRAEGHEVEVQLDTEGALKSAEKRPPDLILLDVMFPGNTSGGFDLARRISGKGASGKKIPIIMVTAINQQYSFGFSNKDIDPEWLPVVEFLDKPVDPTLLNRKVKALLEKK